MFSPEVHFTVCPHPAHQLVVQEADVGDGQGQDLLLQMRSLRKCWVQIQL